MPARLRAEHLLLGLLLTMTSFQAGAQAPGGAAGGAAPVITCTSLANLRSVLRSVNGEAAAAIPIVNDPKSDLGCSVLDRATVTGLADHVALNGRAYDCLALQGTSVCHWTVAGSVRLPATGSAGSPPGKPPAAETGRR